MEVFLVTQRWNNRVIYHALRSEEGAATYSAASQTAHLTQNALSWWGHAHNLLKNVNARNSNMSRCFYDDHKVFITGSLLLGEWVYTANRLHFLRMTCFTHPSTWMDDKMISWWIDEPVGLMISILYKETLTLNVIHTQGGHIGRTHGDYTKTKVGQRMIMGSRWIQMWWWVTGGACDHGNSGISLTSDGPVADRRGKGHHLRVIGVRQARDISLWFWLRKTHLNDSACEVYYYYYYF